jgi:hypothetical protein
MNKGKTMAKQIPQRAEGWKFAGAAGRFAVWHAGKNDYRITVGHDGAVIAREFDPETYAEWLDRTLTSKLLWAD